MAKISRTKLTTPESCFCLFIFATPADKSNLLGDIAQLARALAWHARGQGFDSPYLHHYPLNPLPERISLFKSLGRQELAIFFKLYDCNGIVRQRKEDWITR